MRKLRVAFAVRHGDGDDRALHALEEQAGTFLELHRDGAALVALGLVLHEAGPEVGTGDDGLQIAHHLAAVADAEAKGVLPGEEGLELSPGAFVEEGAFGPALAGAEHIAVAEPAAGREAAEIPQRHAAAEDVGHVNIDGLEPGAGERRGHLDLTVDALLSQNRHRWRRFCVTSDL